MQSQMSERKYLAVFSKDNKWLLAQCAQIFCLLLFLWENANCVFLIKAQITHMWSKLHLPHYMRYAWTHVGDILQQILCYNSKRIKMYLEMKSVTFGVEYISKSVCFHFSYLPVECDRYLQ